MARSRSRVAVALLLAVSLAAARAPAATIVVPDDVATIQVALDAAQPGDTVAVKDTPGPYFEKLVFPRSGAPGASITLAAFPGHAPILDGTGVPGAHMIAIPSRSYVRVIGFEIRNNRHVNDGSGIRIEGAGAFIELRDNRIHDIRGKHAMGITVYGTEASPIADLVIDGNEIYDCEPAQSEALALNGNVERFAVTNNIVRDVNNIGIVMIGGETDIQPDPTKVARDGVCRGNQVYRARSSYGGGFAAGIYVDGGRDIVVEHNVVAESDLGIEIGAENTGIVASGVVVRNNVIHHNDKAGLVFGGYSAAVGRVRDSAFLNNTLVHNDTLGTGFGELWIQFATDNVVRNNLVYANAHGVLVTAEPPSADNALDYNLFFTDGDPAAAAFLWRGTLYTGFAAYQAGSGQDAHGLFADPQLLVPGTGDPHLRAGSPAVNAGDPAFVPAAGETDIDGAPRVTGGRVDIGADELTCGDGTLDPGELCDDANQIDCDGCDSTCTPSTTCGNGIVCAPEACDDGNLAAGDCCSPTCTLDASGSACDDGTLCTHGDACDGAGTCAGSAAPAPACRAPVNAGGAKLLLKDAAADARDILKWTWKRGAATTPAALGDPTADTDYELCLYDSAGAQPRLAARLAAARTCGAKPCWTPAGSGLVYRDRQQTAGVKLLRLAAGAAGKAKLTLRGGGAALDLPAPDTLVAPVTIQLHNSQDECWGATFPVPQKQTATQFKARSE